MGLWLDSAIVGRFNEWAVDNQAKLQLQIDQENYKLLCTISKLINPWLALLIDDETDTILGSRLLLTRNDQFSGYHSVFDSHSDLTPDIERGVVMFGCWNKENFDIMRLQDEATLPPVTPKKNHGKSYSLVKDLYSDPSGRISHIERPLTIDDNLGQVYILDLLEPQNANIAAIWPQFLALHPDYYRLACDPNHQRGERK